MNVIILPAILQKSFKNIGLFSLIVMILAFVSIGITLFTSAKIYNLPLSTVNEKYNLEITEEDRSYLWINWA